MNMHSILNKENITNVVLYDNNCNDLIQNCYNLHDFVVLEINKLTHRSTERSFCGGGAAGMFTSMLGPWGDVRRHFTTL